MARVKSSSTIDLLEICSQHEKGAGRRSARPAAGRLDAGDAAGLITATLLAAFTPHRGV